jgi:hypothetical protein
MPGIHVSSMRSNATDGSDEGGIFGTFLREIGEGLGAQILRITGIESSRDRGMTKKCAGHVPSSPRT